MAERQHHTRFDLLQALVLDEVGPDAPVLLIEDAIVDPPRTRRLQQWVVEEQGQAPARAHGAGDVIEGHPPRPNMLEDEDDHRPVDRSGPQRQGLHLAPHVHGASAPVPGEGQMGWRRVDTHHAGAGRRQVPGALPLAGAGVDDHAGATEVLGQEGQDLLGVLGVDPAGEALLPPDGLSLPEAALGIRSQAAPSGPGRRRPTGA